MAANGAPAPSFALWPLPLIAALLPAVAAIIALTQFSLERGAFCNPFIDDCVSISRMAKHGLANPLFRALVLPGAALQALTWLLAARILADRGLSRRGAATLALLGVAAATMLVVYASFLGSDGAVYGWLRRWGTLSYFGGSYFAMLAFARAARRLHAGGRLDLPRLHERVLVLLLALIAGFALFHGFAALWPSRELEDRVENFSEWWGALALTLAFATMAALWRRWGLAGRLSTP